MNKINNLFRARKISKLNLDEKPRYLNFFSNSYKENLEHCKFNLEKFPRWGIISGYYAMHDVTKLFLADKFNIKIDFNVHQTTIDVLNSLIKDKEAVNMLNMAYEEFIKLLNDLAEAKSKRTKAQYYTGAPFLREKYLKESRIFMNNNVLPYINKIVNLKNVN
jgi:hypothetical protein